MFIYQIQLAWRSIGKSPILCLLMVLSLACGIASTMVCYAMYYGTMKNPLAHKDKVLFMLQTDSWNENQAYRGQPSNDMPDALSYRDVVALMDSDIPIRKTPMTHWGGTVSIEGSSMKPWYEKARITTRDYFAMFEETFHYGSAWSASADAHLERVVVLNKKANDRLFQGEDSVGKTILFERELYRVVGVLNEKQGDRNRMQDIDRGTLSPEDYFIFPFALLAEGHVATWGRPLCPEDTRDYGTGYEAKLANSCLWLSYWVEFEKHSDKQAYGQFIEQYIKSQKAIGYYPRPLRYALSSPSEKLAINGYSRGGYNLLVKVGVGLLSVCVVNTIAMLLAKFLRNTSELGVRRALGANRMTIFNQHLIESALIGLIGALLGIVFTYIGLELLRYGLSFAVSANGRNNGSFDSIFTLDIYLLFVTICVGMVASISAGIYPAWRVCKISTAQTLKSQ